MRRVVIYGAGGFAREVAWLIDDSHADAYDPVTGNATVRVIGYLDDDTARHGSTVGKLPVLGDVTWLADQLDVDVAMGVGFPAVKRAIASSLPETVQCPVLRARSAMIGPRVQIGSGSIICAGTVLTCDIALGVFVTLNLNVTVGHDATIGDYTTIAPGSNISGNVHIGTGCDLGTNVTVLPGVTIGDGAVIGAGACVTRDIPANVTAVGIPAKVTKHHDSQN